MFQMSGGEPTHLVPDTVIGTCRRPPVEGEVASCAPRRKTGEATGTRAMFKRAFGAATVRDRGEWRATMFLSVHSGCSSVIGTVQNDPGSALARVPEVSPNVLRITCAPDGSQCTAGGWARQVDPLVRCGAAHPGVYMREPAAGP